MKRPPRPRARSAAPQAPSAVLPRAASRRLPARGGLAHPLAARDAAAVFGSEEPDVSVGLSARRRERARARRHLAVRRLSRFVAAFAALAALAWIAFASPLLALRPDEIRVQGGGSAVAGDTVRERLRGFSGTPLALLDTRAVRDAARGAPRVLDASVSRRFPHGLVVRVTPRVGRIALPVAGGYEYVDAQGVRVGEGRGTSGLIPAALPKAGRGEQARAIVQVWEALPRVLRTRVAQASAQGGMVSLRLEGGREVRWGVPGDTRLKASVLAVLLEERPARVYDVSDPTKPVVA